MSSGDSHIRAVMKALSEQRKQLGLESPAEYMRHLIDRDMQKASTDLTLLADALGVDVSVENKDCCQES